MPSQHSTFTVPLGIVANLSFVNLNAQQLHQSRVDVPAGFPEGVVVCETCVAAPFPRELSQLVQRKRFHFRS